MTGTIIFFLSFASGVWADTVLREQLSELHTIRNSIKTTVFESSRFQQDILKSQFDLEFQNQEYKRNLTEAESLKQKILERVVVLYKVHRTYPHGALLSFSNGEDFLRRSYYLKFLNNQDRKLISEFKVKTESARKLKAKIEKYMKHLGDLQKRNDERRRELAAQEKRQRSLIKQIREEMNATRVPEGVAKTFFSESRGGLEWPAKGQLAGVFGIQRDPSTQLAKLQTGLVIQAETGAAVKSLFDGEVVHSTNVSGWGPTIIIDHGESYYSIYSHIKNLSVRPGDHVLAQQKLAEVSASDYDNKSKSQGLYFEVRHYSEPEDPRQWLKGEHP